MTSLGDGYGSGSSFGYGFGFGDGSGYGPGPGYGYGYVYGDGYGSGDGDGYGDGYGSGAGSGYGYGDGYGHGHGSGDGDGYGYGSGVPVATFGEYEVRALVTPWGRTVRVGCQVHSLDTWREQWREIAREHGVTVSAEEATRLIALIKEVPLGSEWLESEEGGEHG